MRTEEIKAIAIFMNLSTQLHLVEHPITGEYVDFDSLNYDADWNLLMSVVEKINSKGYYTALEYFNGSDNTGFKIGNNKKDILFSHCECETSITTCYKVILQFINWHNKQN